MYFQGPAVVIVSCVQDTPMPGTTNKYRIHPHRIVGSKLNCQHGVCKLDVNPNDMTATFNHIGIQCVTRREIEAELKVRKSINVDPFFCGFDSNNVTFNLNMLRLAFQVFLRPHQGGTYPVPDIPVSRIIKDKKSHSDLQILNYSENESPFEGEYALPIYCSCPKYVY